MLLHAIGRADLGLKRALNEIRYDPLDPLSYSNASGAALALGDLDATFEYLNKGLAIRPDHIFLRRTEDIAILLSGDEDEFAKRVLGSGQEDHRFRGVALARSGRLEEARDFTTSREGDQHQLAAVWTYAELGDEDALARATRELDASPLGTLQFLRLIFYSGGYAPFEMDAAPNFKARLIEAGADPTKIPRWQPRSQEGNQP